MAKEKANEQMATNASMIDINKIVAKAQGFYGKDKGLAKQLSTGDAIARPTKDSDFILWKDGTFWSKLTGLKGLPFGKLVEVSGRPDSGKSSTACGFMASAQASGYYVILWDTEGKFQKTRYDKHMGGNSKNLLVVNTNAIVEGAKAIAFLINSIKEEDDSAKILVVFDSVGASITSNESGEENEDMSRQPGTQAKEINWAVKKFNRLINQYCNKETGEQSIAFLIINQVYANLMSPGFKEKGGDGLFYGVSLIVQLTRKKDLIRTKSGDKIKYGIVSRARIRKNHLFDGEECLSEMDIVVSADGVKALDEAKKVATPDVEGWDQKDED